MPQDNTQTPTNQPATKTEMESDVVVKPGAEPEPEVPSGASVQFQSDMRAEVAEKIGESKNVLIALSSDPSVDELSAAIGLSLYMDRIGKRATAIYSGATPNTLEFLKPEETFEPSADTLQDFVIAINKDKADHLRYKLDGEYVKMYITPYKHRLSEEDLEFSYGDYNVDLVLALDVANGIDLDSALREHGRIMHDAVIINITTGNPGKFGELEWSDKHASSVSEMIAGLLYTYGGDDKIAKDEATAFLTGIVAATNRFSNAKTTPDTMQMASKLMESGANQQLVSKNITPDMDNELFDLKRGRIDEDEVQEKVDEPEDDTKLDVKHEYEMRAEENKAAVAEGAAENAEDEQSKLKNEVDEVNAEVTKKERTLLDDLKAAEESLSHAGAETTPVSDGNKLTIKNGKEETTEEAPSLVGEEGKEETADKTPSLVGNSGVMGVTSPVVPEPILPEPVMPGATEPKAEGGIIDKPEKVIEPSAGFDVEAKDEAPNKYGQMLQEALDAANATVPPSENPAIASVPTVPVNPEINGVPEMNYMPLPGAEILPPPPLPPVDGMMPGMPQEPPIDGAPLGQQPAGEPAVSQPASEPVVSQPISESVVSQPVSEPAVPSQGAAAVPQEPPVNDPGAFKIPGM